MTATDRSRPALRLHWALAGSVVLHGLLLAALLPRALDADSTPMAAAVAMEVELAPLPSAPAPRENAPVSQPEPPVAEPAPQDTRAVQPDRAPPSPPLPVRDEGDPVTAASPPTRAVATSSAAPAPALPVPRIDTAAAPQQAATTRSDDALPADWQSRLLGQLERYRRYPAAARIRGQEGQPWLRLQVDRRGAVRSVALAQSSGVAALDAEALALPRRAAPLPPPPAELDGDVFELVLPIAFALQR